MASWEAERAHMYARRDGRLPLRLAVTALTKDADGVVQGPRDRGDVSNLRCAYVQQSSCASRASRRRCIVGVRRAVAPERTSGRAGPRLVVRSKRCRTAFDGWKLRTSTAPPVQNKRNKDCDDVGRAMKKGTPREAARQTARLQSSHKAPAVPVPSRVPGVVRWR